MPLALLLALALGQNTVKVVNDPGNPLWTSCNNCSGGGSGVVVDGGYLTVIQGTSPWVTSGGVSSGNPTIDGGYVAISNFPASQPVTGTFWQSTQPVSLASQPLQQVWGNILVDGGQLNVGNFPASQAVTLASTTVTGNVAVTNAAGSVSGSNPCINPTATINGISGSTSGTASVQLLALSGSTKIYVCSMNITGVSGTTPTFKLTYGTGTACAVGTTGIVGPWTTAANTVYNFVGPTFAVTAAGAELCYVQTGTTPISNYNLTYVQQ